jgi:two-component system sensor histidine kinase/response regulator
VGVVKMSYFEEITEEEQKLKAITDSTLDAVLLMDDKGNIKFFNPAAERIFGYTVDEAMNLHLHDTLAPSRFHDAHNKALPQFHESGTGAVIGQVVELAGIKKDGTEFPIELSLSSFQQDGKWWAVGTIRDITARKDRETELQMLYQAIRQSPVTVVITNIDGTIEYVNPKFTELTGYSFDEAIGQNPRILKTELTPKETFPELWSTITSGEIWHGFFANRKKNGDTFWEEAWISPIMQDDKIVKYVGVKLDVTRQRAMEQCQEEQRRELEIYASLLRHDLRNDLSVIVGNIDLAQILLGEEDEEMKELLQTSEAVISRMLNLLSAVGGPSEIPETNPASLVKKVALESEKADKSLIIHMNVDDDAEDLEISSSRLLSMVFDNLFRNAVTHAGENPIVTVNIALEDSNVAITVSDNGPGVSDEIRDRLFQRGASTRGGGLGLYLSRQIINAMNGTIELVAPAKEKGATFLIRLPIKK